jgi:inner membrane protein
MNPGGIYGANMMRWPTHFVAGLAAGLLVTTEPAALIVSGVSALIPDIDIPTSKVGRASPVVSTIVNIAFGHRGLFHSLLATGLAYLLVLKLFPAYSIYFLVGYLSHLMLDCLTPAGVPLLWPIPFRFRVPIIKTGSVLEIILFVCIATFLAKEVFL